MNDHKIAAHPATDQPERLARVVAVLDEWGMSTADGGFVGDEDFAEAIRENGAWRLARDLRAALATDQPGVRDAD